MNEALLNSSQTPQAASQWLVSADCGLSLLKVEGPERLAFLQRLLSNDLALAAGQGRCAYFLNVQGRPLVWFGVFETASFAWLVVESSYAAQAFRELDMLHFGEKLKIHSQPVAPLLHLNPPASKCPTLAVWSCTEQWIRLPYFGGQSYLEIPEGDVQSTSEALVHEGAQSASADLLRELRFRSMSISLAEVPEKTLFLEIASSSDYSETKGCYPGQEVVARTLHRGHINKRLLLLEGDAPGLSAGAALNGEAGTAVGTVLAVCQPTSGPSLAFAIVRRGNWEPGTELRSDDGMSVRVVRDKG